VHVLRRTLAVLLVGCCAFLAAYVALRSRPAAPLSTSPTLARSSSAPAGASSDAASSAAIQASPQGGSESASTVIPETLPDARVPDLTGASKSLRDFLGHPLIVNFWATWCEPCRREMPLLQQLQQRYQNDGLQVLGVAIDSRPAVEQYLRTRPVNYPILAGETEGTDAMNRFGAQPALPFSVFADASGRIILLKVGELHPEEADYILSTERAISAGKETITQARASIEAKLREFAIARAKASGNEGHQIR
jgi:thiol-disulfide isomerase/thioredoxin